MSTITGRPTMRYDFYDITYDDTWEYIKKNLEQNLIVFVTTRTDSYMPCLPNCKNITNSIICCCDSYCKQNNPSHACNRQCPKCYMCTQLVCYILFLIYFCMPILWCVCVCVFVSVLALLFSLTFITINR